MKKFINLVVNSKKAQIETHYFSVSELQYMSYDKVAQKLEMSFTKVDFSANLSEFNNEKFSTFLSDSGKANVFVISINDDEYVKNE